MEASALHAPRGIARINLAGSLLRLRSDEQLVAIFRAGNDGAFDVIHERYRVRLHAYARQMLGGSAADAEDAMQDVFMRAYSALRANDRPVSLRAWLYRVAHNRCIDHLRKPVAVSGELLEEHPSREDDPFTQTEKREDLRRLVQDVRRLPEQQRSVLLMRELEGLSYNDLAEAHDVSVPAIKSLLVRARVGLVASAEARDTTCIDIRDDLSLAHGRGVRANARARRHMRDCGGCRDYREGLKRVESGFGALAPAGGGLFAAIAKLFGGGGTAAGGGAAAAGGGSAVTATGGAALGGAGVSAAGGAVAIGGGGAAIGGGALAGGTVLTAAATKVAVVVASAVVAAGGAVEVKQRVDKSAAAPVQASAQPNAVLDVTPLSEAPALPAADAPVPTDGGTITIDDPVIAEPLPDPAVATTGGLAAPATDVSDAIVADPTAELPVITPIADAPQQPTNAPPSTDTTGGNTGQAPSDSGNQTQAAESTSEEDEEAAAGNGGFEAPAD